MERRYEQFNKIDGKYVFMGWYTMMNEDYCIETKTRGRYIYKKYQWKDGSITEVKYGGYVENY